MNEDDGPAAAPGVPERVDAPVDALGGEAGPAVATLDAPEASDADVATVVDATPDGADPDAASDATAEDAIPDTAPKNGAPDDADTDTAPDATPEGAIGSAGLFPASKPAAEPGPLFPRQDSPVEHPLFPAPFGPRNAVTAPGSMRAERSSTAVSTPKRFVACENSSTCPSGELRREV
ncbi:hypothetical protein MICRO8M_20143 [Microbacterium sp. 8M]|uniref:hypothetical protein n=1 Tax=Microbacterium sp. 8M TaxID=2653153 RepID=UPI0012F32C91|nr:hypothetical protein [Microbacterium sp. 8M]VXB57386.1 hypothetical protein MICRO8M_20143 [Microbacterium sp. 8M]